MDVYFDTTLIKRLLYIVLINFIAFSLYYHYQNAQAYWLVWSILTASLITSGDTFKERIAVICITGIASAIGVMSVYYVTNITTLLAGLLLLITLACVFIGERYPQFFFPTFSINLLIILAVGFTATRIENLERTRFVLIGFLITGIIQIFFSLHWMKNELRSLTISTLRNLKLLTQEIFACLLNIEYTDNIYLFERRLHMQKNKLMQTNDRLQKILEIYSAKIGQKKLLEITHKIEVICDLIIDCSQLRRRVTDHTIFDVCKQDLEKIEVEIENVLSDIIKIISRKKNNLELTGLNYAIDRFEEIYDSVLQVIAPDPIVFLLFIESLKALSRTFIELSDILLIVVTKPSLSK